MPHSLGLLLIRSHGLTLWLPGKAAWEQTEVLRENDTPEALPLTALMTQVGRAPAAWPPLLVALDAPWVLPMQVTHEGPAMTRHHEVMAYLLEEHLPLSAEESVCDFVVFESKALGIAAEIAAVLPWVEAIKNAGLHVHFIAPWSLLAVQALVSHQDYHGERFLLWETGDQWDLFELRSGRPWSWTRLPATDEALRRELLLASPQPDDALLYLWDGETPAVQPDPPPWQPLASRTVRGVVADFALECTARIAAGSEPWIELQRGELGEYDPYRTLRGAKRLLYVSAVMFLLALAAALEILALKYDDNLRSSQQELRAVYQETFPAEPPRTGMVSRFESETKKLAGAAGQVTDVPELECALTLLYQTLASLPADLRYRLTELRVEAGTVYLDGELRTPGDADAIAAGLRSQGFSTEPPRLETLPNTGVSFNFSASLDTRGIAIAPQEATR